MRRRLAGLLLAAVTCVSACGTGADVPSPRGAPAPDASAAPTPITGPPFEPQPMAVTESQIGFELAWPELPGAVSATVRQGGRDVAVLNGDTHEYLAPDPRPPLLFTAIGVDVAPVRFTVVVRSVTRVLGVFTGAAGCPSLVFVAARGSGQNVLTDGYGRGLGNRAAAVLEALRRELEVKDRELPAVAVDYPAVPVGFENGALAPGDVPQFYSDSVRAGVRATRQTILQTLSACPGAAFVLFGYSQGGQVVGDAFAGLEPPARASVKRVILFAEARYHPDDPQVVYRPRGGLAGGGIKGPRSTFPAASGTVIESWCWEEDVVCQGPRHGRHFHGDVYDSYQQQAAHSAAVALAPFVVRIPLIATGGTARPFDLGCLLAVATSSCGPTPPG